jgi:hypothetical protein
MEACERRSGVKVLVILRLLQKLGFPREMRHDQSSRITSDQSRPNNDRIPFRQDSLMYVSNQLTTWASMLVSGLVNFKSQKEYLK